MRNQTRYYGLPRLLAKSRNDEIVKRKGTQLPCHCERSEAIHNLAYFKDSIAESKVDKVMDLRSAGKFANANVRHENQRFSRNDAVVKHNDKRIA